MVLGLLRDEDVESGSLAPMPRLVDLTELAETVQASGTPVMLRTSGTDSDLSPALELSIYRVVQEALTNVVKHAPGARATVEVAISPAEVRVEVTTTASARARCQRVATSGPDTGEARGSGGCASGSPPSAARWWPSRSPIVASTSSPQCRPTTRDDDQRPRRRRPGSPPGPRFPPLINAEDDLRVVGEALDGRQAVELALSLAPDVVVMDVRMPVMDGIEATRRITSGEVSTPPRVLILTTFDLDEYVFEALRAGASGFASRAGRSRSS